MSNVVIVSSDGHATARMRDYRPYLPAHMREDFDAFCETYEREGSKNFDIESLRFKLDPEEVERWQGFVESGRLEGYWNVETRLRELDGEGIAAEVLFPDFGLPFEMRGSPSLASTTDYQRTPEQVDVAYRAYNRWLVDLCSGAQERFAPMAAVSFDDVDAVLAEVTWAKAAGMKGVVLPHFDEAAPVYHPRHEPVWSLLEDLGMVVNCHTGISSVTKHRYRISPAAPEECVVPLVTAHTFFMSQQLLTQFIWGGVLERHPRLKIVMTEMGSAWVIGALRQMDYSWEGSYLRRDTHNIVKRKPSEYFRRQCYLGSSLYSRAEVEARYDIGLEQMMLGMDYPHHEGNFLGGTVKYLQATVGAARVPAPEVSKMLGETAARVYCLDQSALDQVAARIGPRIEAVLEQPTTDHFPRGDVHKPLVPTY
jgi:predicted TIM-barrel fold metal-dependent hydrolase